EECCRNLMPKVSMKCRRFSGGGPEFDTQSQYKAPKLISGYACVAESLGLNLMPKVSMKCRS
ncbi:hypothetical protein, partial [Shewanella litorisediminis]|uniref:hypothetical protein n=1 Tax=Shewanella litorisediminis TaxID=1173586 RepID=UPI0036312842